MKHLIPALLISTIFSLPLFAQERVVLQIKTYQELDTRPQPGYDYFLVDDNGHTYALPSSLNGEELHIFGKKIAITGTIDVMTCIGIRTRCENSLFVEDKGYVVEYPVEDDGTVIRPASVNVRTVTGQINASYFLVDSNDLHTTYALPPFLNIVGLHRLQTKVAVTANFYKFEYTCFINHPCATFVGAVLDEAGVITTLAIEFFEET